MPVYDISSYLFRLFCGSTPNYIAPDTIVRTDPSCSQTPPSPKVPPSVISAECSENDHLESADELVTIIRRMYGR